MNSIADEAEELWCDVALGHAGLRLLSVAERWPPNQPVERYLYVAVPGVRDYLQYGGHGLLVFDIDDGFKFVKRMRTARAQRDRAAAERERHLRFRRDRAGCTSARSSS